MKLRLQEEEKPVIDEGREVVLCLWRRLQYSVHGKRRNSTKKKGNEKKRECIPTRLTVFTLLTPEKLC